MVIAGRVLVRLIGAAIVMLLVASVAFAYCELEVSLSGDFVMVIKEEGGFSILRDCTVKITEGPTGVLVDGRMVVRNTENEMSEAVVAAYGQLQRVKEMVEDGMDPVDAAGLYAQQETDCLDEVAALMDEVYRNSDFSRAQMLLEDNDCLSVIAHDVEVDVESKSFTVNLLSCNCGVVVDQFSKPRDKFADSPTILDCRYIESFVEYVEGYDGEKRYHCLYLDEYGCHQGSLPGDRPLLTQLDERYGE